MCEGTINITKESIKSAILPHNQGLIEDSRSSKSMYDSENINNKNSSSFEDIIEVSVKKSLVGSETSDKFLELDINIKNKSDIDIQNFELDKK
jgi:pectate lyase